MSVEALSVIISAAGLVVAMFSGFAWVIHRTDSRIDKVDSRIEALTHEVSEVKRELSDVRVAVARLEGPFPRLLPRR